MTFVHFTSRPSGVVIPSVAKNPSTGSGQVSLRPFTSFRVTSLPCQFHTVRMGFNIPVFPYGRQGLLLTTA